MQGSVTVHMAADPETFEATWLRGASGPAVGAYFKGHVTLERIKAIAEAEA